MFNEHDQSLVKKFKFDLGKLWSKEALLKSEQRLKVFCNCEMKQTCVNHKMNSHQCLQTVSGADMRLKTIFLKMHSTLYILKFDIMAKFIITTTGME